MDAISGHRRPQHRHAAAAGPGLGGDHVPARRLRRPAGQSDGLTGAPWPWTAGRSSSRPASWPGAARSSRWPPWSGGRGRRPASRARGRSSPPPGELHGWIGGACAEPVVIREAREVIAEGAARLLLLGTPGPVRRGGARGDDRGADLVPERGRARGLHRAGGARAAPGHRGPLADGADAGRPGPGARLAGRRWWPGEDFTAADADERSMVVVATQGHGDEEAVEQAVAARPAYLGLVGSRKRGAAVLGYLAERGRAARPARPGAGAGRPGPRADHPPGDRGGDPGRAGPAAGRRARCRRRPHRAGARRPPWTRCAG